MNAPKSIQHGSRSSSSSIHLSTASALTPTGSTDCFSQQVRPPSTDMTMPSTSSNSPRLFVAGEDRTTGDGEFKVVNPLSGKTVWTCPSASSQDCDDAVDALAAFQPEWERVPPSQKRVIFLKGEWGGAEREFQQHCSGSLLWSATRQTLTKSKSEGTLLKYYHPPPCPNSCRTHPDARLSGPHQELPFSRNGRQPGLADGQHHGQRGLPQGGSEPVFDDAWRASSQRETR